MNDRVERVAVDHRREFRPVRGPGKVDCRVAGRSVGSDGGQIDDAPVVEAVRRDGADIAIDQIGDRVSTTRPGRVGAFGDGRSCPVETDDEDAASGRIGDPGTVWATMRSSREPDR